MSKKKKIAIIIFLGILICLNVAVLNYKAPVSGVLEIGMELKADHADTMQIYSADDLKFQEQNSFAAEYSEAGAYQELRFQVDLTHTYFRLDLGQAPGNVTISRMYIKNQDDMSMEISLTVFDNSLDEQQIKVVDSDGVVVVETEGSDPYIAFKLDTSNLIEPLQEQANQQQMPRNILFLVILDAGVVILAAFHKRLLSLPTELIQNRRLILKLAVNDFKTKYAGSYLGIVWAFIQPIVTIMVYWFVFSVGLKAGNAQNYPFVLYLTSGIVPWFFFQDALNGGTNALLEYNYLVKKVVFKISILPIVKIISALFVHVFFVGFALILCSAYGYVPTPYAVQLLYYSVCTFIFALGIVYATSAIVVFFRDLTQIINIILQVGVWLTPIMWDLESVMADHPFFIQLFKINPMYYIVTGYRDSMLGKVSILAHVNWGIYFWIVTLLLFGIGTLIFKRLKPHFADVL